MKKKPLPWHVVSWREIQKRNWYACKTDVYRMTVAELIPCYRAIADWALKSGIRSVGGPLFSGALIAQGICLAAKGRLNFFQAPAKQKSVRHVRKIYGHPTPPVLLVDDMVESGRTMEQVMYHLLHEIEGLFPYGIFGIVTFDTFPLMRFDGKFAWEDKPLLETLHEREKLWAITQKRKGPGPGSLSEFIKVSNSL